MLLLSVLAVSLHVYPGMRPSMTLTMDHIFFPEFTCSAGTNFFSQRLSMGTRYTRILELNCCLVCIQTDHSGCILQCIKLNIDMRTCLFAVTVYHLLTIVNVIVRPLMLFLGTRQAYMYRKILDCCCQFY